MQAATAARAEAAIARTGVEQVRAKMQAALEARAARRRRGPKPARNWQDHVLREIICALDRGEPIPSGPALAQSCLNKLNYQPDVSAINKLIKNVLDG